ncbi:hypothetical protein WJX73_008450 [Symbiochloris irregularis]|uniref:Kinesin motor domain-containing protein n=1 Tax=Symbiochloris irregularis TaxID=706552 RepID=A0AAW1NUS7_9CHLO
MNAQLQRTKDGATEQSRIAELAGLVKVLRRCLKESDGRLKTFAANSVQHEKELERQAEGQRLTAESSRRQLEAQVAILKRDAAQAVAAQKAADASWQAQVDSHRAEASHSRQELQRFQAERDKARDEVRRAEAARNEVLGKEKGIRREAGQQLRELEVGRGEALRLLQEAQSTARQREQELLEGIRKAEATADAAQQAAVAANANATTVGQDLEEARADLRQTREDSARTCAQLTQALQDLSEARSEASDAGRRADGLASSLATVESRYKLLLASQGEAQGLAESFQAQLQEASAAAEQQSRQWEAALAQSQAREAALGQEKGQLKGALAGALEQQAGLEASLSAKQEECRRLQSQLQESQHHCQRLETDGQEAAERLHQAQQALQDVSGQLQQAVQARSELEIQSQDKAARLARMEGELGAIQDAIGTGSTDQAEMLGRLISRVAHLDASLAQSRAAQRAMHNQLVELRGNIRVFCRLKPSSTAAVAALADGVSVAAHTPEGKDATFTFDRIFAPDAQQSAVFAEAAELVQCALDGYQVCLFAYGQTGSGKTHTMQGTDHPDRQGIIPRAVAQILEQAELLEQQGWQYELHASYIEVYNETLRDLLAEGKGRDVGKITDQNAIRHDPHGGQTMVVGAVRAAVQTPKEAQVLMRRAGRARAVEATAMNAESSRSHSVFMLHITGRHAASDTCLQGALNLVDLAGSERLARSGVEGQRAKEACLINKSLSALADVFSALAAKSPHVPHRNSKLTHLLQPCLGGTGKTLMLVNINPEPASIQESLCTLRFAAKVNGCETGARGGAQRHVTSLSSGTATASRPAASVWCPTLRFLLLQA